MLKGGWGQQGVHGRARPPLKGARLGCPSVSPMRSSWRGALTSRGVPRRRPCLVPQGRPCPPLEDVARPLVASWPSVVSGFSVGRVASPPGAQARGEAGPTAVPASGTDTKLWCGKNKGRQEGSKSHRYAVPVSYVTVSSGCLHDSRASSIKFWSLPQPPF